MANRDFGIQPELDIISEGVTLPFPPMEYRNRVNKIRKKMYESGIDMLYLTSPESMYYVTGLNMVWYAANSSSLWDVNKGPGVAVHVDSEDVLLFQMADEFRLTESHAFADEVFIKAETDNTVINGRTFEGPGPGQDVLDLIVKDLRNRKWLNCRVGLELGCYRPPARVFMALQEKFLAEGCTVSDGTDIVASVRNIKSPMELNYIRRAAAIADIAHRAIASEIHGGMTELQVVGIHTKAAMDAGGEAMGIVQMVRSGIGKVWMGHPPASRRVMMPGEPVAVDLSGVYNRYHANVGRFYHIGEPTEEYAEEYRNSNAVIMEEVRKLIKPGMMVRDFFKEMVRVYEDLGLWDDQAFMGGYEMGIAFPPDWCGEFVYDAFLDMGDKIFEPGMTVNFETGFGVIDPIIFLEDSVEFPSRTSYELCVVPETRAAWEYAEEMY